jgi:cytidylate kinase
MWRRPIFAAVKKKINIAIDGYSSCGKSTLAKALAKKLHYRYLDSGAMYRAVTLYAIHANLAANGEVNETDLLSKLDEIDIDFVYENGHNAVRLNGVDVEGEIRSMEVSNLVSHVSKIAAVRAKLRHLQQKAAERGGVVMDGRDIGSAVLPDAQLKIFMTAQPAIRADRRYRELHAKGSTITREEVEKNLMERDHIDTTRSENPLTRVPDARLLDNSHMSEAEQLDLAHRWAMEIIAE